MSSQSPTHTYTHAMLEDSLPKETKEPLDTLAQDVTTSLEYDPNLAHAPKNPDVLEHGSLRGIFNFTRRRHVPILLLAIFCAVVAAALKTASSIFLGFLFQAVTDFGSGSLEGEKALADVVKWCLVMCALAVGSGLSNMVFFSAWTTFGTLQAKEIRLKMFTGLLDKEMDWFDTRQDGISSMLVRTRTQIREFQTMIACSFGYVIMDVFTTVFSIILGFLFSWKLALVMLSTVPISAVALNLITSKLEAAVESQKACLAEASRFTMSSLGAVDIVKVYNGFDHEVWQYLISIRKAAKHYRTQTRCNSGQKGYVKLWIIGLFAGGFTFGIFLLNQGALAGSILTAFYATLSALNSVEGILPTYLVMSKGVSASHWLRKITDGVEDEKKALQTAGRAWPPRCSGAIRFNAVSFAYPSNPAKTILYPSSFSFPSGQLSFIVGKSGSGKSTVGNLLVRFYEPRSGEILIDDVPLRTIDIQWIRHNITLIQQASVLFNDTLHMNVALGHIHPTKVTRGEVKEACFSALLQSTISSLPDGLDTQLGPGGARLSGGQMQKLALARAKLRDPPVLILDEVTSGLDQASGILVLEAIRFWRRGKTTIIITHNISQIEDGDLVYVMDQGRVVQTGIREEFKAEKQRMFAHLVPPSTGKEHALMPEQNLRPPWRLKPEGESLQVQATLQRRMSLTRQTSLLSSMFPTERGQSRYRPNCTGLGAGHKYGTLLDNTWQQRRQARPWSHAIKKEDLEIYKSIASERMLVEQHFDEESCPPVSPEIQMRIDLDLLKNSGTNAQRRRESSRSAGEKSNGTLTPISPAQEKPCRSRMKPASLIFGPSREVTPVVERDERKEPSLCEIYKTVWPRLEATDRLKLVLAVVSTFTLGITTPAFSFLFAGLVTTFSLPAEIRADEAKKWTGLIALVVGIEGAATFYSNYLFESVAQSWVNNLRIDSLKKILVQSKEWHAESANSKERLSSILDRDGEEMRNLLGRSASAIIAAVVMGLVSIFWAMAVSWKLALVAITAGPVVLLLSQLYAFVGTKYETLCEQSDLSTASILSETIINIRLVRSFTLEHYFTKKYVESSEQTSNNGLKLAFYCGPLFGATESATMFLPALVFYYGMVLLTRGEFELSEIVQAINLLLFSIGSASVLLQDIPHVSAARAAAAQILRLSNLPHDDGFEHKGTICVQTPLPVKMRDVHFSYPNHAEANVLRGVNMVLRSNETVAIVGSSGCGKSTVASLLLRLYLPLSMDPWSPITPSWQKASSQLSKPSPLTYSGVPAEKVDTTHLRRMISYVPQHPHLFPLTLAENIAYGLPACSELRNIENIALVAKRAGIHQLALSLPQGYGTKVGEGGATLSGGQTQRVGIARALLRLSGVHSGLVIMDEPTASLDAQGAQEVRETLRSLVEDKRYNTKGSISPGSGGYCSNDEGPDQGLTLVLITHSKEMMKMADRLLVMDHGVVVEEGEYHELLARGQSVLGMIIGDGRLESADKSGRRVASGSYGNGSWRVDRPEAMS